MLEPTMSTGILVNLLLLTAMAVALVIGLAARGQHKRNARHARYRVKH